MDSKLELEQKLRNCTLAQLQTLLLFATTKELVVTTSEIGDSTSTIDPKALAGLVSSVSKIRINNEPLILKIGRIPGEGTRYRLNDDVISRSQLADILEKFYIEKSK